MRRIIFMATSGYSAATFRRSSGSAKMSKSIISYPAILTSAWLLLGRVRRYGSLDHQPSLNVDLALISFHFPWINAEKLVAGAVLMSMLIGTSVRGDSWSSVMTLQTL